MFSLEVGEAPLQHAGRRSPNLVFSIHAIPAALEMQLSKEVKLSASLPVTQLLQHLPWYPEEQRPRLTLFSFFFKAGVLALAVVWLMLGLDRRC